MGIGFIICNRGLGFHAKSKSDHVTIIVWGLMLNAVERNCKAWSASWVFRNSIL